MGGFTVALGLPRLVLLQPQFQPQLTRVSRLSTRKVLYSHTFGKNRRLYSHSFSKNRREYSSRRIGCPCSASVSWPYESWAPSKDQQELPPSRGVLEQEGGVEALAMGVGVVVSVAVAFAKQGSGAAVAGVSVGILSLAILTATTVALRQHLAGVIRMLVSQFNTVQAAMVVQLSSIRKNVIIWGTRNEATASSPTVPIESDSFAGLQENRQDEVNSIAGSEGLSSAEIEAALSHIAKSVAHLTMVVANLDNKISSLEKETSNNVSSFRTPTSEVSENNKIVEEDVTRISAFTDVEERQSGTYRIRNSNGSGTQLKWEEAFVKDRRANQVKPKGCESSEDSRTSNRVDVFSKSEYDSKALPSTILYDSRGDRVLLLDSRPVDVTFEVGSIRENLSQSARSKFSKAQTGDSPMEFFFQDVGARAPKEDGVPETKDQIQSKQDNAAVELSQDAGFRTREADGKYVLQSKKNVAAPTARNPVENVSQASPVPSGAQDNDIFRNKVAPRRGKIYNEADAQGKQTPRVSWEAIGSSNEYELDGSEGYRVVPKTLGIAFKPDAHRLKRIMTGTETSAAFSDEATQPNAWTQNETNVSEMSPSKVLRKEKYGVSGSVGNNSRSDEYGGVSDRVGVGRRKPGIEDLEEQTIGVSSSSNPEALKTTDEEPDPCFRVLFEDPRISQTATERSKGAARPLGVQDVLSYDGQERSPRGGPRPEGSEGIKSSSKADYGQRWGREGSSDASDADFGGNGNSSDTNEGGNGSKRRQGSSGSSVTANDSDREVEPPTSQDRRPSRGSPSYPSERTETFRNLPEPNSDDEGFQKLLDEVEALLKEGREGLEGRIEVGVAERMLYEAAELCEKAVGVRPSSLVAVGLWGNTLLLHGELKLRLSQNLRSMLPEPPSKSLNRQAFQEAEEEKLSLESTLQDVGEECEQLLVEAGRKYRLALSMDRNDMRALYNWGLALCYRGQLIAEEGGETAAQDADKVFLAAIDKFEAMIGLSDSYAAGALLNWGLAMRDRSRLRPLGSKERQRILGQAKEIFQEALRLDPNYGQARGAVAACVVELKGLQEYEEEPKKPIEPSTSRGFRDWWG